MKKYRIIQFIPGDNSSFKKAQVKRKFLFWSYWEDICSWQFSTENCENFIKYHKGEISNVETYV